LAGVIGKLPFVKAVCVVNSVAIGNVHEDSDIDLLIVTTPGRVFVAKGFLWKALKILKLLETEDKKAGQFSLGMVLTTRGVIFERDIMRENIPHLIYWLMTAVPVYGQRRWQEVLQASPYVRQHAPNYLWPKGGRSIDRAGTKWLDSLDDRGYKYIFGIPVGRRKTFVMRHLYECGQILLTYMPLIVVGQLQKPGRNSVVTWVEPDKSLKPLRPKKQ
jgi:predicted nucleotidyltransferase